MQDHSRLSAVFQPRNHLVERHWKLADRHSARVIYRVAHRRAGPENSGFANALDLERVGFVVHLLQKVRLNRRHTGMGRNVVLRQVVVDEAAITSIKQTVAVWL